jgi:hypothetical protein
VIIVIAAGCAAVLGVATWHVRGSSTSTSTGSVRPLDISAKLPRGVVHEITYDPHQPAAFRPELRTVRPAGEVFGMKWFISEGLDPTKVCLIGVSDGSDSRTPSALFRCSDRAAAAVLEYGISGSENIAVGIARPGVVAGRYKGRDVIVGSGLFAVHDDCGGSVSLSTGTSELQIKLLSTPSGCARVS